jgi:hypothetical protein
MDRSTHLWNAEVGEEMAAHAGGAPDGEDLGAEIGVACTRVHEVRRWETGARNRRVDEMDGINQRERRERIPEEILAPPQTGESGEDAPQSATRSGLERKVSTIMDHEEEG